MEIRVQSIKFDADQKLLDFIDKKVNKLSRFFDDVIRTEVVLSLLPDVDNKNVKIKARFDKFSTLGLDYKPAMKSSEDYISFLIQRPDVLDHNVPLSELKIFIKRTEAEKHIDLDAGDIVEFSGKVFSNALGDVWMDAEQFNVLTKKNKDTEKKAN